MAVNYQDGMMRCVNGQQQSLSNFHVYRPPSNPNMTLTSPNIAKCVDKTNYRNNRSNGIINIF